MVAGDEPVGFVIVAPKLTVPVVPAVQVVATKTPIFEPLAEEAAFVPLIVMFPVALVTELVEPFKRTPRAKTAPEGTLPAIWMFPPPVVTNPSIRTPASPPVFAVVEVLPKRIIFPFTADTVTPLETNTP